MEIIKHKKSFFKKFIIANRYQLQDPENHYEVTLANLYNYGFHKISKLVFIIFFIVMPLTNNLLGSMHVYTKDINFSNSIIQIIDLVLVLAGFLIIYWLQGGIIFRTGAGAFFLFKLLMGPFLLFVGIFAQAILGSNPTVLIPSTNPSASITVLTLIIIIAQILTEIGFIYVFFRWNKTAKTLIINTFKSWKNLKVLGFSILLLAIMFGVAIGLNYISFSFNQLPHNLPNNIMPGASSSDNQNMITNFLTKWWGILIMAPLTLLIAPVAEEIAYREGIFSIFGREVYFGLKTHIKDSWKPAYNLATKIFVITIIMFIFANEHVVNNIENIYQYLGASVAFSLIYLFARYNFTYAIVLHIMWNIFAFISVFVQVKI